MKELAREDVDHPYVGCGSMCRAAVLRERLSLLHEQAVADVPIRFEGCVARHDLCGSVTLPFFLTAQ
jgi:hypothetical protein